ncbi:hypothetical protein FXO37_08778 [Capsicum annuum]|nr:hypothetical protein FXO37_08778 [Capsicum annuum]
MWGDSSSESNEAEKEEDMSVFFVEECKVTYDLLFDLMKNTIDEEEYEISEIREQCTKLKLGNLSLMNKLKKVDDSDSKGNKEASSLQIKIEEKLRDSQNHLMTTLYKNEELERDFVRLRDELSKSLKWTTSSQNLSNLTSQIVNNAKVLGYQYKTQYLGSHGNPTHSIRNNADLWHTMLGIVSSTLLNKLNSKDLVYGMQTLKFLDNKVCNACVKGKQTKSSLKRKKQVSTSRPLKMLQIDPRGPVKVQARWGNEEQASLVLLGGRRWLGGNYVRLEYWAERVGCANPLSSSNSTIINLVGLPAHLWCYDLFKKVEDLCAGFMDVVCSMHDLTRVRVLVNKGGKVPVSVVVDDGALEIRIWMFPKFRHEVRVRERKEENEGAGE